MTATELDRLLKLPAGPELDEAVGLAVGYIPGKWIMASSDGGKSSCAHVDQRDGPWYSEHELRQWLAERHAKRTHLEYSIVIKPRWPRFSQETVDAIRALEQCGSDWELFGSAGGKWHGVSINVCPRGSTTCHDKSLPLAICRALIQLGTHKATA